jgi:hypothetical protein
MILMGITVSCYCAPIILSCVIYFTLLRKDRNFPENDVLEENLNQIQQRHTSRQSSREIDKLEHHFEIPGIIIEDKANKSIQSIISNQNQQIQSNFTAAFPHLISFVMFSIDIVQADMNFEGP